MKLYTILGCPSCKRAKTWMKDRELEYEEINLYQMLLEDERFDEFYHQLILEPQKFIKPLYFKSLQDKTKDQLKSILTHNPSIIIRPILTESSLSEEEKDLAQVCQNACKPACSFYETCRIDDTAL